MFTYWAYGLEIKSELEFPEMFPYKISKVDVEIKFGPVEEQLNGPRVLVNEKFTLSNNEYLIHLPICSFHIKEGRTITLQLKENADLPSVRLFLLTNAMAAILHQRKKVALHAGAIQTHNGLVVICGESSAGKSTTVCALHQKGHKVFVDDVLVLESNEDKIMGIAAYPTLKLWDDSIEKLMLGAISDEQKIRDTINKYRVSFQDDFTTKPVPIYKIFYLCKHENRSGVELCIKEGVEAFKILYSQLYRTSLINNEIIKEKQFERLNKLLNQAKLTEIIRPAIGNSIENVVQLIEQEIQ